MDPSCFEIKPKGPFSPIENIPSPCIVYRAVVLYATGAVSTTVKIRSLSVRLPYLTSVLIVLGALLVTKAWCVQFVKSELASVIKCHCPLYAV